MSTREPVLPVLAVALKRLVIIAGLTIVAFFGGVAVTQLWPVHTSTTYFAAEVSVSPQLDSTVHLPMVVGDLQMRFDGILPAPGLIAQVQVREEVTDLLRSGRLRTADLEPDSAELRAAIDQGVREVGWKFALGSLVTTALVLFSYALSRPRNAGKALLVIGTSSTLALGGPAVAAYLTYRPHQVTEFNTTSLLSTVQANTGFLDDLTRRSDQGAIYVTNLLALSEAMRQEFSPEVEQVPTAARFLLVSDIHGMNLYPLMQEIIRTEGITAVIDSGDLLNFGRPEELDLSNMRQAIANLGVPYLFVLGNHDAAHLGDESLLHALGVIPNVVLLEPTEGQLRRVQIAGVSVSGFNDRRYFAEEREDFGEVQSDLAARYVQAVEELEPTDLVVTHQPYAAKRVNIGAVTISGHMHQADLEGSHIQVGSFTGGGLVNHFRLPSLVEPQSDEDPETAGELEEAPFSFDILTVGTDCSITSLARYSYRNLVSGNPQYDNIRLINGRALQPDPPVNRVCGAPDQELTVEPWADLPAEVEAAPALPETTPLTP